ncbi:MAG: ComEA family DNA-binding protein [Candidatus Zixiibacteriota bacterium]
MLNRYFDFSGKQIRFVAFLAAAALLLAVYLAVRSLARRPSGSPQFEVIVGENEKMFTGIFVLDPNTAPADSLELLPGIGTVLADRIVAHRQHECFEREVDITDVRGIGPKMYERLRPYLRVAR